MSSTAAIRVVLTANASPLQAALSQAAGSVQGFQSAVVNVQSRIGGLTTQILGTVAAAAGLQGALGAISSGFARAANAEQLEIALTTMTGSADTARQTLADVKTMAAQTPFEFPELAQSTRSLIAFGVPAEQAVEDVRRLGDMAAGTGMPITELAELYGKMRVQGRLFAQDINQLTGRGIPIIQALAAQFGVTEAEVRQLVESGSVSFENLEAAMQSMTAEGSQFGGMMEAQSQTLAGKWSTLTDTVGMALESIANEIIKSFDMKTVIDNITALAEQVKNNVGPALQTIKGWWDANATAIAQGTAALIAFVATTRALAILGSVIGVIRALVATIRTIAAAQGLIAKGQAVVLAMMGPAGWGTLIAGAAAAAVAIGGVAMAMDGIAQAHPEQAPADVAAALKEIEQAAPPAGNAAAEAANQAAAGAPQFDKNKQAVEDLTRKLQEQASAYGMTSEQAEIHKLAQNGATDAQLASLEAARQNLEQVKAQQDATKAAADYNAKLREQLATIGMTAAEAERYKLAQQGVSTESLAAAAAMQAIIDQKEKQKAVEKSVEDITKGLKEQIETAGMTADQIELYRLAQAGASEEQLAAVQALQEQAALAKAAATPTEVTAIDSSLGSKAVQEQLAKMEMTVDPKADDNGKKMVDEQKNGNDFLRRLVEMAEDDPPVIRL